MFFFFQAEDGIRDYKVTGVQTCALPISWLADRWGARGLMAGSMLAFALAAWACGEAGSFGQLVGWRFIQGMAGGLVIPVGQALAFNRFQGPERARVSTLVMAVALIAPAPSPRLGRPIVDPQIGRAHV